jgi:hypothetical protein
MVHTQKTTAHIQLDMITQQFTRTCDTYLKQLKSIRRLYGSTGPESMYPDHRRLETLTIYFCMKNRVDWQIPSNMPVPQEYDALPHFASQHRAPELKYMTR